MYRVTDWAHPQQTQLTTQARATNTENVPDGQGVEAMPHPKNGSFESAGRTVDEHLGEWGDRFEQEVRRVITYLNDQVVPEVRVSSSKALRVAVSQLSRLADHLDSRRSH
jgi:hypothetical protein